MSGRARAARSRLKYLPSVLVAWGVALAGADEVTPCVPGTTPCCFQDTDGDPWDLSFAAGVQTTRGPSTTGDWAYEFSICNNVAPVPAACEAADVVATAALRHESTICQQLGPDINLAPTAVAVTKAGSGVLMVWAFSDRSFNLEIECGASGIPGLATAGDDPYVIWRQDGICDAGPGEPIEPVPEQEESRWGRTFLILLGVGIFLYVAGFTYMEQSHNGRSGTACFSGLGKDSFPPTHVAFWTGLPSLVADGVYFFRVNVGTWHPSLAWLYPARSYEDLNDETEADSGLHALEARSASKRETTGLMDDADKKPKPRPKPRPKPQPRSKPQAGGGISKSYAQQQEDALRANLGVEEL